VQDCGCTHLIDEQTLSADVFFFLGFSLESSEDGERSLPFWPAFGMMPKRTISKLAAALSLKIPSRIAAEWTLFPG
jgi:hypothetical protein